MIDIQDLPDEVFEGKRNLVISDAFPPYTVGGAEISLSISLEELSAEERTASLVVAFFKAIKRPIVSTYEGFTVIHLPEVAAWPYEHLYAYQLKPTAEKFPLGPVNYARFIRIKQTLKRNNRKDVAVAYQESRFKPSGGILVDTFTDKHDLRVTLIARIARRMPERCTLIADNTRSILIGSEMTQDAELAFRRSVAVVRDNRFFCARPSQNRVVKGKICAACNFSCAAEDCKNGGVEHRKKTLGQTRNKRQQALRKYSGVVTTSHELVRQIAPILDDEQNLRRIPNPFGHRTVISKAIEGIAQSSRDELVIIGMMNENKGQLRFLEKALGWIKSHPSVKIVLCGRGERIAKKIEQFREGHKLQGQIQLAGYRDREQIYRDIRRSKIVLAPTVWVEPFGRVPLEAAAAGRPIVSFGVGGLNETIIHNVTGLLVKHGDYKAFLDAVDYLLENPHFAYKMGKIAREIVEANYAARATSEKFVNFAFSENQVDAAASRIN